MPFVGLRRVVAAILLLLAALGLSACGGGSACVSACGSAATSTRTVPASDRSLAPSGRTTDLPTIWLADLPPEAFTTLRNIAAGGPYPYRQDGAVFSNREGRLPSHPSGWYHEYTVVTPGSSDRGARRIIEGKDGSMFWTDDHYASFYEILNGEST